MSEIALTSAQRSALLTLQNVSDLSDRTQTRLSTGRKVNSVVDDAVAFFQGKALTDRAADFNLRKDGIDVSRLMSDARGIAFSAGSACASGSGRPSHVLAALGLADAQIKSSIRLGFGRYSTAKELKAAADLINRAAEAQ